MGMATFFVDSFSGRGITETATDQSRLSSTIQILDAYRAVEWLSTYPRLDPARIALMGFSKGGIATLYASLTRFQRLYGSAGADFAAYIPFYPFCNYALREDEQVSERPIRIFHGTADDVTPIEPCRQYAERLCRAGKDVQLIEYAGAHHAFDDPSRAARYPPGAELPPLFLGRALWWATGESRDGAAAARGPLRPARHLGAGTPHHPGPRQARGQPRPHPPAGDVARATPHLCGDGGAESHLPTGAATPPRP
jgi:dienelactone hydrolase